MAAQTVDKARPRLGKNGRRMKYPMTADTVVKEGTIVSIVSGLALEGATATTHTTVGVAWRRCDNAGGAAAAKEVEVDEGDFPFDNSTAGDALTNADIGAVVYLVNNNQVAKTNGGSTRSVAGRLVGFFSDGRPVVRIGLLAK
jgi:hypothetical protein